jgi:hypothetical protein
MVHGETPYPKLVTDGRKIYHKILLYTAIMKIYVLTTSSDNILVLLVT